MRTAVLSLSVVLLSVLQQASLDASISGRVTHSNPAGGPANILPALRIAIGSIDYRDGRRTFVPTLSTGLGADGSYQLRNVRPGEYYLRVESPIITPIITYYPGTRDIEAAMRIAVNAGQELVGIEFDTNIGPMFKVSGTVRNMPPAIGAIRPINPITTFTFVPADRRTLDPFGSPLVQDLSLKMNGEFEISLPVGEVGHPARDSETATNELCITLHHRPHAYSRERPGSSKRRHHGQFS